MAHRLLTAFLAVSLLVLSSCGSGDADTPAAAADDPNRPQSFEDLDYSSPIGDLLGFDFGDEEAMQQEIADMERRGEEVIASCMREQGFEYTPRQTDAGMFVGGPFGDELPYWSDEWVDKYGFGVSTMRFSQSEVGPDLVGFNDENMPGPGGPGDAFSDPNEEYLSSLTDGEREAWQTALYGEPPDFSQFDEEDGPQAFEPSGCQGRAFEEVFAEGPGGNSQAFFEAFGDDLESLFDRVMADPRVIEFNESVETCVAEKGLVWTGTEEAYEIFEPKLADIGNRGFMGDPFEGSDLDPEEMSEEELEEFFADMSRLSDEDREKLRAVQEEELALARVVVDCGGGELNREIFLGDVRQEYEQQFLDDNADRIGEILES